MADAARDTRQQAGEQRRKGRRDPLVESDTARRKRVRPHPGGAYRYSSRPPETGDDFLGTEPALQPIDQQKSAEYTNYQDKYDPRKQKLKTRQQRRQEQLERKEISRQIQRVSRRQNRLAEQKKRVQKKPAKKKRLKTVSFALKLSTRLVHLFSATSQIWFSLFVIAGMAVGGIIAGFFDIIGIDSDRAGALLYVSFYLALAVGWMKLLILSFILLLAGTKPFSGARAEIKLILFLTAFVFYSFPVLQMFPVSILWTEYVFRHPR